MHDSRHRLDVHDLTKDVPAILAVRNIKQNSKSYNAPMFSIVE